MAITIACKNYNAINLCENSGDWTGSTPGDVTDFYKEGSQCIGFEFWKAGDNDSYISVTEDLSGTTHLHLWFMCTTLKELNTDANGGIQFYLSDGANTGYWYVSGSDSYPGGWINLVIDLSKAVDSGTKPNMSAITTMGIRVNLTTGAKKAQCAWVDHIYAGDGLIIYGDDAGSDFDFADVLAQDELTTNGWGMIRSIGGVFYLIGSLTFGDASGTGDLKFKDLSQIVIFEDRPVNASLYDISVVNNGTGTGNFQLGNTSGGKGIQGCTIKSEGAIKYSITAVDTDIDIFKLYGCNLIDASIIDFPVSASGREVLSCTFEACGVVDPDTCVVKYCNFINADGVACYLATASHQVSSCNFIANPHGLEFAYSTLDTLYGCLFSGSNGTTLYDAKHSDSGAFVLNKGTEDGVTTNINGAYIEETGGGSTTVVLNVDTIITVRDITDSSLVSNARVLLLASDNTGDFNYQESVTILSAGGVATVTHSGHGLETGDLVFIEGVTNDDEYNGVKEITYISTTQYSYVVSGTPPSPAVGTILSTTVMFNDLTISGVVSDSRTFALNQPLTGRIRKSTTTPLYKTQPFSGIVDNGSGLSLTILLVRDD